MVKLHIKYILIACVCIFICAFKLSAQNKISHKQLDELHFTTVEYSRTFSKYHLAQINAKAQQLGLNKNQNEIKWVNYFLDYFNDPIYSKFGYGQVEFLDSALVEAYQSKNSILINYTLELKILHFHATNEKMKELAVLLEQKIILNQYHLSIPDEYRVDFYNRLALFFYRDHDYEAALENFKYALSLKYNHYQSDGLHYLKLQNLLGNIALSYQALDSLEKAKTYLNYALKLSYKATYSEQAIGINKCNLAHVHALLGNDKLAIKLFKEGLTFTIKPENHELSHAVISITQLIPLLLKENNIKEAIKYQQLADNLVAKHNLYNLGGRYRKSKALIAKITGNYKESSKYAFESLDILDSLHKVSVQKSATKQLLNNELLNKTIENNILKGDFKATKFKFTVILYSIVFALILLALIGYFLYRYINQTKSLNSLNQKLLQSQENLKQTNKKLINLNNQKTYLVQTVAHDLRNPIGNIIALTNLIAENEDELSADQKELFDFIQISSKHSLTIIEDILDLSAIERENLELKKSVGKLVDIIKNAVAVTLYKANVKNISIKYDIPSDIICNIDADRFTRMVQNLLTNAIKFSKPGSNIDLIAYKADNNFFTLEVIDKGVGISAERIKQIFEPYTTSGTEGTFGEKSIGLGLSISKKIIELHGGEINVESKPNEGSKFMVTMPINL